MFIEVLIISLIYSKIKDGKLNNLEEVKLDKVYLIVFGFFIQLISLFLIFNFDNKLSFILEEYYYWIHILSYFVLFLGIMFNYKYKGFLTMGVGMFFNFLPILFNGGKMPVSERGLIIAGLENQLEILLENNLPTHILSSDMTKLKFLIDFIPIPRPYIFPKVISIGDIILAIGLFIFINEYTRDD